MIDWKVVRDDIVEYIKHLIGNSVETISYPTSEKVVIEFWNRKDFEKCLGLMDALTDNFNEDLLLLYTRERVRVDFKLNSVLYELIIEFSER